MEQTPKPVNDKGKILLADDDDLFRGGLARMFLKHGYECVCAANATETIEILRQDCFDALIADIYMPGNAGLELIEEIPQIAAGLPVILLTGRPSMESAIKSVNLSVVGYLVKPPDWSVLQILLDRSIESCRASRKIAESRQRFQQWAHDLIRVEKTLQNSTENDRVSPITQYLKVMSENIVSMLDDMGQSLRLLSRLKNSSEVFQEHELREMVEQTIVEIEQTKQNFKSHRLGRLRSQLQDFLQKRSSRTA